MGHKVVDRWPIRMWGFLPEWRRKEGRAQIKSRCDGDAQSWGRDAGKLGVRVPNPWGLHRRQNRHSCPGYKQDLFIYFKNNVRQLKNMQKPKLSPGLPVCPLLCSYPPVSSHRSFTPLPPSSPFELFWNIMRISGFWKKGSNTTIAGLEFDM